MGKFTKQTDLQTITKVRHFSRIYARTHLSSQICELWKSVCQENSHFLSGQTELQTDAKIVRRGGITIARK